MPKKTVEARLTQRVREIAAIRKYELFQVSTAKHPEWPGPESEYVKKLAPG